MVAGTLPGKTQTLSLAVYSATQAGNDSLANELVLADFRGLRDPACGRGQDHQTQIVIRRMPK